MNYVDDANVLVALHSVRTIAGSGLPPAIPLTDVDIQPREACFPNSIP